MMMCVDPFLLRIEVRLAVVQTRSNGKEELFTSEARIQQSVLKRLRPSFVFPRFFGKRGSNYCADGSVRCINRASQSLCEFASLKYVDR